jgi:hypothetical protein
MRLDFNFNLKVRNKHNLIAFSAAKKTNEMF